MAHLTSAYGDEGTFRLAREAQASALHGVSWGAILAGVALALVAQFLLLLLGLGVGLLAAAPGTDGPSASTLSIGACTWWALSGILASAMGGFLAGRLCGRPVAATSGYHGLVSWAATTLVVLFLTASAAGGVLGGAFGAVTGAIGGVGGAVQAVAPSLPQAVGLLPEIEGQIKASTGGQDPAQLREAAVEAVKAALTGDAAQRQSATDRAADALAKAQNVPPDQARAQVQRYQERYAQAMATAKGKAVEAAEATSEAALLAFAALLVGAVAAFFCGRLGTSRVTSPALPGRAP